MIKVQPYVLRSWEKEFPDLGTARTAGGPRFYRPADVERLARAESDDLDLDSGAARELWQEVLEQARLLGRGRRRDSDRPLRLCRGR